MGFSHQAHLNKDGLPKWGTVKQCPYCPKVDIPKLTHNQKTCGRISCQEKANNASAKKRVKKA